ncbi:histidine phosphatase family protein [Pseudomonas fluorescens]|uniref:Lipopolysaccharide core heptose(II)-phosphate phosphatase n=1 Tax=Pseudomonas fluorescens TaxID=294 RepID=A0A5E7CEN7_PSEFL|nr:histidine phosphatase family protein [Pseudomonas fluorescens]VVN98504.1 Lipopolysaccharide core heptose(II)-phosphate phosphatase [Pseudomonas fluorescens]
MQLRLDFIGVRRSLGLRGIARYRNAAVILVSAVFVLALTLFLLKPAAVPDLANGNASVVAQLKADWAKGEMIVLVRHVERCDHSRATCLGSADGITERSRNVAAAIGSQFRRLDLSQADIYNSPLTRAAQTSSYMFNKVSSGQDWLIRCKGHMLSDALSHKVPGRNLILVTHSECMSQLESDMKFSSSTLGYGASLFVSTAGIAGKPQMLGFIEASDWDSIQSSSNK